MDLFHGHEPAGLESKIFRTYAFFKKYILLL